MTTRTTTTAATIGTDTRSDVSLATILFVAFIGAALLFTAAFAQPEAMHDAAHDTRHAIAFPCH